MKPRKDVVLQTGPGTAARFPRVPDAGWKAGVREEWLRYLAISWMHVMRER
jgi:hypothetical protein